MQPNTVLSPIVKDNGNRQNDSLFQLSIEELHKRLDNSLFGNEAENYKYKKIALDECWSRFNICPEIDIFDYWSIYLVESSSEARVIYSSSEKNIFEINLKAGLFDGIIQDVYDALVDIYEIEVAKESTSYCLLENSQSDIPQK